jgi:hypothetical protein
LRTRRVSDEGSLTEGRERGGHWAESVRDGFTRVTQL